AAMGIQGLTTVVMATDVTATTATTATMVTTVATNTTKSIVAFNKDFALVRAMPAVARAMTLNVRATIATRHPRHSFRDLSAVMTRVTASMPATTTTVTTTTTVEVSWGGFLEEFPSSSEIS